ncbi:hypothetical protein P4O66_019747 [Electrophorus voltai]|uniref:Uncharacterized protein n=1 Tax=Electrophorus voltai TaxID=2609070 RepID=A0AAD8ZY20_9TELE|nr:hypothetical protein P4O66_019747 [Electrophorus voltai]
MKGEHLFAGSAPFIRRVYLLGGELVVLQPTTGEATIGDSFHQITDFNDLPTSLFACNVDQSVFEEQEGKTNTYGAVMQAPANPTGSGNVFLAPMDTTGCMSSPVPSVSPPLMVLLSPAALGVPQRNSCGRTLGGPFQSS